MIGLTILMKCIDCLHNDVPATMEGVACSAAKQTNPPNNAQDRGVRISVPSLDVF